MNPAQPEPKKLYRNTRDAWIAGVASGLAEYSGIDKTVVRLVFILLLFLTFGGMLVAYVVMWLVVPARPLAPALVQAGNLPPQP